MAKTNKLIWIVLIVGALLLSKGLKKEADVCVLDTFRCNGQYSQICGDFNNDGYLEWPTTTSGNGNLFCAAGCAANGRCIDNSAPSPTNLLPAGQFNVWPNSNTCTFISNINPIFARYNNYLIIVDSVWQPTWISIDTNNDGIKESYGIHGTTTGSAVGCDTSRSTVFTLVENYNAFGDDIMWLSSFAGTPRDQIYVCKYDHAAAIIFDRNYNTENAITTCGSGGVSYTEFLNNNAAYLNGDINHNQFITAANSWVST